MKIVTFKRGDKVSAGALVGDKVLDLAQALSSAERNCSAVEVITASAPQLQAVRDLLKRSSAGPVYRLADVKLLAPIPRPQKNVFCVGRNYKEHILEGARARGVEPSFPKVPEFFSKPPTTVIAPDDGIERHAKNTSQLDYEVELAIVIGKRVRDVSPADAMDSVFGYTIVNDVSARDAQFAHGQWFKGKSFDTFCPMGPCIVTADEFGDPSGHRIMLKVNGEIRQDSTTSDLLFTVAEIVSALAASTTLEPGDIISTGTPSGVALGMTPQKWLQVGDVVEAEIEGIGRLRNVVVE
jgi:2-keto-4-pentenoate hydratase/2-oxohepta-3-ene-1,7-dioic acid hydratase in catechol pathway